MTYSSDNESDQTATKAVGKPRWYVVQVGSGCEKKVKADLEQRIASFDLGDRILQIRIPQTPTVKVRKDGSRVQGSEKVLPGYVLIEMILDDDAWQTVKNTPNVINFVGSEKRRTVGRGRGHVMPVPLSPSEVARIFKEMDEAEPVPKIDTKWEIK